MRAYFLILFSLLIFSVRAEQNMSRQNGQQINDSAVKFNSLLKEYIDTQDDLIAEFAEELQKTMTMNPQDRRLFLEEWLDGIEGLREDFQDWQDWRLRQNYGSAQGMNPGMMNPNMGAQGMNPGTMNQNSMGDRSMIIRKGGELTKEEIAQGMNPGMMNQNMGNQGMNPGMMNQNMGNQGMSSGMMNQNMGNQGMSPGMMNQNMGNQGMNPGMVNQNMDAQGMNPDGMKGFPGPQNMMLFMQFLQETPEVLLLFEKWKEKKNQN
jgi:hypothetical protein